MNQLRRRQPASPLHLCLCALSATERKAGNCGSFPLPVSELFTERSPEAFFALSQLTPNPVCKYSTICQFILTNYLAEKICVGFSAFGVTHWLVTYSTFSSTKRIRRLSTKKADVKIYKLSLPALCHYVVISFFRVAFLHLSVLDYPPSLRKCLSSKHFVA
jgi:hypothetical protein